MGGFSKIAFFEAEISSLFSIPRIKPLSTNKMPFPHSLSSMLVLLYAGFAFQSRLTKPPPYADNASTQLPAVARTVTTAVFLCLSRNTDPPVIKAVLKGIWLLIIAETVR